MAQTALRTKEGEFSALAQERDRLAKKLADQEESHKAALKAAQDSEAALKAEYETEAASWAEARQALSEGYGRVEDLVDGRPPSSSLFACPCKPVYLLTCSVSFFFVKSTFLATPSPPTKPSKLTVRPGGRLGLRSHRTPTGRLRSSFWRSKPASSRPTACSAIFSVRERRC